MKTRKKETDEKVQLIMDGLEDARELECLSNNADTVSMLTDPHHVEKQMTGKLFYALKYLVNYRSSGR